MEISLDLNLSAPSLLVATTWCPVFKVSTTTELRIVSGTEYEMAISDSRATSKEASFSRALGSIKSKSRGFCCELNKNLCFNLLEF